MTMGNPPPPGSPEPPAPPPAGPAEGEGASWLEGLGPRVWRRAEPRLAIALAGAGCALAVLGVLVIAFDALGDGGGTFDDPSSPNTLPGIALCAALMIGGYLLIAKGPGGPLDTAGIVASALAAPPLWLLVTFDEHAFPPFPVEAVFALSSIGWLVSYAVGPGKGHAFYLGSGLIGIWLTVLEIVEGVFTFPFDVFGGVAFGGGIGPDPFGQNQFGQDEFGQGSFGADPFAPPVGPDLETLGVLTLLFAAGYAVAARRFDRSGRVGLATPFAVAALVTAPAGLSFLADALGPIPTGLALMALGVAYGAAGATTSRRLTTWVGGAYVAYGIALVGFELLGDDPSATETGFAFTVLGGLVVAGGWFVTAQFGEQPETEPGPSTFDRTPTATSGRSTPTPF